MVKKYKVVRIPIKAYENLEQKRVSMVKVVKKITGKQNVSLPFTKFIKLVGDNPIYLDDKNLVNYTIKKRK